METMSGPGVAIAAEGDRMAEFDTIDEARPLPLDGWHRAHGARMVPFAGHAMPIQYEGIVAEHLWTRASAGLFDVSHMGQLLVVGDGAGAAAESALEALLPADLASLATGRTRYSLLLAEDGGILDDLMITRAGADAFLLVVNGATKQADIAHLRAHLPPGVTLDHQADQALLALQGPLAAAVLDRLLPCCLDGLAFLQSMQATWQGIDLRIGRSGYTGEDGFEIALPATAAAAFADALLADDRVRPAGLGARDSLRLEAGLPLYGHDLNPEIDPVTAGLAFAVAKRRRAAGGFPGAATIARLIADGASRRRVGLALDGRLPAREGAPVLAAEGQVGLLTSGGFAPSLERPVAMAYVAAAHAAIGSQLTVEVRGKQLPATVVPMPFVPHAYHRTGAGS
jgi:aminomethyltransferase